MVTLAHHQVEYPCPSQPEAVAINVINDQPRGTLRKIRVVACISTGSHSVSKLPVKYPHPTIMKSIANEAKYHSI